MAQSLAPSLLSVVPVTIANAGTNSTSIDTQLYVPVGISFPAVFTGTSVIMQVSQDNATWIPVNTSAGAVSITPVASTLVLFANATAYRNLDGVGRYIRFVSGSAEAAPRTLNIHLVPRS